MKTVRYTLFFMSIVSLVACVTINVYFPEAAAEQAADRFIERVIGPEEEGAEGDAGIPRPATRGLVMRLVNFVLPAAHAQADIDISTPAIRQIQSRMAARFDSELAPAFDAGAIGLTNDALVEIRDLGQVGLSERNQLKAAVQAENRDRLAVYREIAVANGHPEWEAQIRSTFAQRWIARARGGWYYQDANGNWRQK